MENPSLKKSWEVDPLSDLVTATELRNWRNSRTTKKVLRYLARWRASVVESLAEGDSLLADTGASAMKTSEYVAKCQVIKDILGLEAKDIAAFYQLPEPKDEK